MVTRIELDFSRTQLLNFINKNFETNRLLAAHENSDGQILDAVAAFEVDGKNDRETIDLCLKHPNITVSIIEKYGATNWGRVATNPTFNRLLIEGKINSSLMRGLLRSPYCPVSIINSVAAEGGEYNQYNLLHNPIVNEFIRGKLLENSLSMLIDGIDIAIENTESQEVKKYLEDLRHTPRMVFLPVYIDSPIEPSNLEDRLSDQLIYGYPFTSDRWPWPKSESQVAKQPLLQLNLENAGKKLGLKLGEGILQVWINSVDEEIECQGPWGETEFRIIPSADLSDPLEVTSLKEARWLEHKDEYIALGNQSSPRINWIPVGFQLPLLDSPVDGLTEEEVGNYWNKLMPERDDDFSYEYAQLGGYPPLGTDYGDLFCCGFSRDFKSGIYLIFNIQCTVSDLCCGLALFAKIKDDGEVSFECTFAGFAH